MTCTKKRISITKHSSRRKHILFFILDSSNVQFTCHSFGPSCPSLEPPTSATCEAGHNPNWLNERAKSQCPPIVLSLELRRAKSSFSRQVRRLDKFGCRAACCRGLRSADWDTAAGHCPETGTQRSQGRERDTEKSFFYVYLFVHNNIQVIWMDGVLWRSIVDHEHESELYQYLIC